MTQISVNLPDGTYVIIYEDSDYDHSSRTSKTTVRKSSRIANNKELSPTGSLPRNVIGSLKKRASFHKQPSTNELPGSPMQYKGKTKKATLRRGGYVISPTAGGEYGISMPNFDDSARTEPC